MSAAAVEEWSPSPVLRTLGFKDRACGVCGWRFFTTTALHDHEAEDGCHPPSPAQVAAWREAGRRIAARNNAVRRCCGVCGMTSTRPAIGIHQKATGHTGWTEST